uniref:(northern house mosquito) hypothetical protein n=1 Tax=Culex pipiens TaxID=7175 RepID=A0A8D8NU20_CULPI
MLSIFLVRCKTCGKRFTVRTENPEHKDSIRKSAVWATIAAGETHSHSEEFLAHMNIPFMCFSAFESTEHCIYDIVQPLSAKIMEEAIEEEKKLAKFHDEDGTPSTTVIVDGSWPVRSYGSKYSSRSGAAVIFGIETRKVLYADTRNTFCIQCYYNDKNGVNKKHKCFVNYSGSPGSMEVDVLLSGLNHMEMLGLKAKVVCGDDDSSAFDNIKDRLRYGEDVRKAQCINHKLKNFKKKLIAGTGKSNNDIPCSLMRTLIDPMCAGARGAINHCAAGGGVDIEGLAHDLDNLLNHNVGIHKDCRTYFCDKQDENDYTLLNTLKENETLFNTVQSLLHELALDADRLCYGLNTNDAENFMGVIAKFTLGKRLNLCNRGSYSLRVLFAVCSVNKGYGWAKEAIEKFTGRSVSSAYLKYFEERDRKRSYTKAYQARSSFKRNVTKKFIEEHDYGPSVQRHVDMAIEGPKKKAEFMMTHTEIRENVTSGQALKFAKGRIILNNIAEIIHTKSPATFLKKSDLCSSNAATEKTMRKIFSVHKAATKYIQEICGEKFIENLVIIHHVHPFISLYINGRSDDKSTIFIVRRVDVFRKKKIFQSLIEASKGPSSLGFKQDGDTLKPDRTHMMEAQVALSLAGAVKCYVVFVNGGAKKDIIHVCIDIQSDFMEKSVNQKLNRFIDDYFIPQLVKKSIHPENASAIV